ncbi:MAG: ArsR/SmtB family transcription factor [Candidatus Methanomethylicaceae archaeon]
MLEYRAMVLKAMADPVRLQIIELLKDGERCVCEIIPSLGKSQSTTSKSLDMLHRAGILERRKEGCKALYKVKDKRVFEILKLMDSMIIDRLSSYAKTVKSLKSLQ